MSPAPAKLSQAQIVDAAVALLDAEGLERFSMRKLGVALGVDPMAVYHHVPNKSALLDAVVDALWAQAHADPAAAPAGTTEEGGDWRPIAAAPMRALRRTLLAHPRLTPVLGSRPALSPAMLSLADGVLGRLARAGLPPQSGMALLDCLVAYTVGKVLAETQASAPETQERIAQVQATLTSQTHPNLVAAAMAGYGWAPEEEFEHGLLALLDGWPDSRGALAGRRSFS